MSDSMFNEEQLEYTKWLSQQPRETLCQCGWYKKNECPNIHTCIDADNNKKEQDENNTS